MRYIPILVTAGLLLAQQGLAHQAPKLDQRAAFRQAVEDYQIFVIPHCAPDDVQGYVSARAARDRAFVHSLRHTVLETDYKKAVADRAAADQHTIYECFGPPPPPPPPGAVSSPSPLKPDPAQIEQEHQKALAEHFAGGDKQFATMERLRNDIIGSRHD